MLFLNDNKKRQIHHSTILETAFASRFITLVFLLRAVSYSAWARHKQPVKADESCSQTTTENRVNGTGLAILSIPVPFESPRIAICTMHVWSVPLGGSVSSILSLMLSRALGTNGVL